MRSSSCSTRPRRSAAGDRFIAERVRQTGRPTLIVVNKTDRARPEVIARTITAAAELIPDFAAVHPVSALTGDGLAALRAELARCCPRARPTSRPSSRPTRPPTSRRRS